MNKRGHLGHFFDTYALCSHIIIGSVRSLKDCCAVGTGGCCVMCFAWLQQ